MSADPAFVGLVASRRRAEGVLGYLTDRGVPPHQLARVHAPVGLDLGHTSHREIAVAILAELVRERAAGGLVPGAAAGGTSGGAVMAGTTADAATSTATTGQAVDPVCGMTVRADRTGHPVDHDGETYYFCCVGCRDAFVQDPASYVTAGDVTQEA